MAFAFEFANINTGAGGSRHSDSNVMGHLHGEDLGLHLGYSWRIKRWLRNHQMHNI